MDTETDVDDDRFLVLALFEANMSEISYLAPDNLRTSITLGWLLEVLFGVP